MAVDKTKKKKRVVEDEEEDEAPRRKAAAKKRKRAVEEDEAPRRSKRSSSGGSTVVTLDFTKDESEGGRRRFPEGDYRVKVKAVKMGHSSQKHTPQCAVTFTFLDRFKGETIRDVVYITDKALWRIRSLFAAAGTPIPKKKMKIDFKDLIGETLVITVADEEYEDNNGKSKKVSRVQDFMNEEDWEPDDEDDEDEEDDDEDDEDDDDDDMEDMDVDDDL